MMMMMDRRAGGGGGSGNNASGSGCWPSSKYNDPSTAWKMGKIMLGFRPIAPKPPVPGSVPVNPILTNDTKSKRKRGGGVSGRGRGKKLKTAAAVETPPPSTGSGSGSADSTTSVESTTSTIVTLPLLPETPEIVKDDSPPMPQPLPWLQSAGSVAAPVPVVKQTVMSWVTVERITETWHESEVGGGFRSDAAVVRALETDTAPAFVSDEWGRVCWTNDGYRKMVLGDDCDGSEVRVGLVARSSLPAGGGWRAFTCMVRARHDCRQKGTVSMAAPCDVWRMNAGGWAWRLDLKAALSLSL